MVAQQREMVLEVLRVVASHFLAESLVLQVGQVGTLVAVMMAEQVVERVHYQHHQIS